MARSFLAFAPSRASPLLRSAPSSSFTPRHIPSPSLTPSLSCRRCFRPQCPIATLSNTKPKTASATPPISAPSLLSQCSPLGLKLVVLKRGRGRLIRERRSLLVFGDSVAKVHGDPLPGDVVAVVDGVGLPVGFGFYNPTSMLRIRLLRRIDSLPHQPVDILREVERLVRRAFSLRANLGLPSKQSTAFRLVNGIADGLSGLVVDVYGHVLVASSSALWVEKHRDLIVSALRNAAPAGFITKVVWRSSIDRLRQDGFERAEPADGEETDTDENLLMEEDVQVFENGVQYHLPSIALRIGQKTGHFTDQRDARLYLRQILASRGSRARVLDLFSYSGGFGVNAALAGAEVICVDSSESALALARENARHNNVEIEFVKSDVSKFLTSLESTEQFSVVICDPPKFAPNAKSLPRATRKYHSLYAAAMRHVENGGLLLTCSCSAAVSREAGLFDSIVRKAAVSARTDVKLLRRFSSSSDHPTALEEPDGDYLTAGLFACFKWADN